MCDTLSANYIDCMKLPIKEDKCKKEFLLWDRCYKNAYLKEFSTKSEIAKKEVTQDKRIEELNTDIHNIY